MQRAGGGHARGYDGGYMSFLLLRQTAVLGKYTLNGCPVPLESNGARRRRWAAGRPL
jgi:hypothetical protein